MTGIKRALLFSTADRYFALVANFVTLAIASRILTPAEVGVSVVGMAVVGIAMALREFASANVLFQQRDLGQEAVRSAFTVILVLTIGVALLLAATSSALGDFYDEPRLMPYLLVIAVSLIVETVALPIMTLLRRDMDFARVAIVDITGAAAASVVTIALALAGFSFMSFAWAWFAAACVTGALALWLRPNFWIYRPSLRYWRTVIAFGGYNGATTLLYKAYESLPYLVLGRLLSLDAAALYSRSLMISQLPDKIVLGGAISVILPAFSAETRQGRPLKIPYLRALALITGLQWPALATLATLAYPAVDLLLGHQWHAVAPLVQIVSIASFFSFSFELNYPVLVSMGAVRDIFKRALIICPISALVILTATFYGLDAVAWSLMAVIPFQAVVSLAFVRRHIGITWPEVGAAIWKSAVVALMTVAGPAAVTLGLGSVRLDLEWTALALGLAAVGWFAGLWATAHVMLDELLNGLTALRNWRPVNPRLTGDSVP